MPALNRRSLIVISAAAVLLLFIGFGVGRITTGGSTPGSIAADTLAGETPTSDAQMDSGQGTEGTAVQGSDDDPDDESQDDQGADGPELVAGDASAVLPPALEEPDGGIPTYGTDAERDAFLAGLAFEGVNDTAESLLATADHVCFSLERLEAQNRSAAYAVRVVWNESLAELESEDLAVFASVFNAAPLYLCLDSIEYGSNVAYWLGY